MKFSLNIGSVLNFENFSLSQLVRLTKELFAREGIPGFISVYLEVVEKLFLLSQVQCKFCGGMHCHVNNREPRKIKTSIGPVTLNLTRVKCQDCKKTFVPMNVILDLDKYSRKSRELEKLSLEIVTNQSFRRSADELTKTLGFDFAHTSLHGWFKGAKVTAINVKRRVENMIADGTGFKRKRESELDTNKGEVKVVVGMTRDGEVFPYGAWTRASWKNIGSFLKSENKPSDRVKFKPIATTLITDGEEPLINALKKLATSHQRCLFHMTYELKPLLQYKDFVGKEEAKKLSKELGSLLYIPIPEPKSNPLKNIEDKLKIEIEFKKVKEKLDGFIQELKLMGYKKACNFVENARDQLYTYIENWLKADIVNPKVTSLVERIMREIKRRIKKIGFSWSDRGAEQMTRLVLLQLSQTKPIWEDYWGNKMGTESKIDLRFLGVTVSD